MQHISAADPRLSMTAPVAGKSNKPKPARTLVCAGLSGMGCKLDKHYGDPAFLEAFQASQRARTLFKARNIDGANA
jgi:hypothetical protein